MIHTQVSTLPVASTFRNEFGDWVLVRKGQSGNVIKRLGKKIVKYVAKPDITDDDESMGKLVSFQTDFAVQIVADGTPVSEVLSLPEPTENC